MAFLARLGAWALRIVFPLFFERIMTALKEWYAKRQERKEAEALAKKSVEDLKKAQTKDEIDAGADSALDKF